MFIIYFVLTKNEGDIAEKSWNIFYRLIWMR